MRSLLRRLLKVLAVIACVAGVMQIVPYGRARSNPSVVVEPAWDSPRTRELAKRACFDCHSNETSWPWYAKVAPMSWVMQRDVDVARSVMNFSDWTHPYDLSQEAGATVIRRDMPPHKYKLLHGHAHLTDDETIELARGLAATFGSSTRIGSRL
jgi:hypothetical protein